MPKHVKVCFLRSTWQCQDNKGILNDGRERFAIFLLFSILTWLRLEVGKIDGWDFGIQIQLNHCCARLILNKKRRAGNPLNFQEYVWIVLCQNYYMSHKIPCEGVMALKLKTNHRDTNPFFIFFFWHKTEQGYVRSRMPPEAGRQIRENKASTRANLGNNNNLACESLALFTNSCILAKQ